MDIPTSMRGMLVRLWKRTAGAAPRHRSIYTQVSRPIQKCSPGSCRSYSSSSTLRHPQNTMAESLFVDVTTPNGVKYKQPTGIFINNEFVKASGGTIVSIDPA